MTAPIEWRWAASATRTHLAAVYQCGGCRYPWPHWGHRTYAGYRARTACGHGPTGRIRLWLAWSTRNKAGPICELCWRAWVARFEVATRRQLEPDPVGQRTVKG